MREVRTNDLGQFNLAGIPAGEYFAFACAGSVPEPWIVGDVLGRMAIHAERVSITVSSTIVRRLRARVMS
jgi:hypothetical protein